jgi:hypothetical protein
MILQERGVKNHILAPIKGSQVSGCGPDFVSGSWDKHQRLHVNLD